MRVGYCSNTHSYVWESSNAHCITTLVFAVLSFDTSSRSMLNIASVLQVPICQAVVQSRLFLQSKIGRELLQGKNSFAQMSLSSRNEDDQDGGLYQPQKTHRHTSAVRWTIIQIVPVKSLLQSPLSGLRLLQVQIADAGDRETIAKTDV